MFGQCDPVILELLNSIQQGYDPYLIGIGFKDYIDAQDEADRVFSSKKEFCKRIVTTLSNLGKLQIDKGIRELCDTVWDTPSVEVPKPSLNPKQRVRSWSNLLSMGGETGKSNDEFQLAPEKPLPDEDEEVSGNSSGSLKDKTPE